MWRQSRPRLLPDSGKRRPDDALSPRPAAGRAAPAHAQCGGSATAPQPWRTEFDLIIKNFIEKIDILQLLLMLVYAKSDLKGPENRE